MFTMEALENLRAAYRQENSLSWIDRVRIRFRFG